ncbi:MAG: hypothetical protein EXS38_06870 [Opitutus sp.]|nr:hypothetical protein [Opitutus sp.]
MTASSWFTTVVLVAGLAVSGAVLGRVAAPVWTGMRQSEPGLRLDSVAVAGGRGVTLALLGGFRTLVADGTWLRMYLLWEQRDLPSTDSLIHLVTTLDPRPVYFWLNGARILAYDLSAWRIELAGGYDVVPASEQTRIDREQAGRAMAFLAVAMGFHPATADLWIERANIELNRLRDVAAAAESYRRAFEMPQGPYYAARLHAQLLRRLGRKAEALDWLVRLHPRLPAQDDAAGADVVLGRIRELEAELGLPAAQRYQASPKL